ncbi:MAG: hypothetical protein Unbinned1473contig1001_44 [Prokaryotic dsDNA virus sp.]|nr:MAG: hypothetical protein Unbinned1473contig1001_44 [Prokaryotic dsDNA virus sp.]|tara:strand:+ start:7805 stop:8035 length:231 start_codon:yes stop_codon:yes gene_type:complete
MIKTDLQKKREFDEEFEELVSTVNSFWDILKNRMGDFQASPNEDTIEQIKDICGCLNEDIQTLSEFVAENQHTTTN